MFGKTSEIAVSGVLGHELPGGVDVLFDGRGSESGGRNVFDQVQADRWFVCESKNPGVCVAQVAPSTAVRDCADGVFAEDALGCWFGSCC